MTLSRHGAAAPPARHTQGRPFAWAATPGNLTLPVEHGPFGMIAKDLRRPGPGAEELEELGALAQGPGVLPDAAGSREAPWIGLNPRPE